MKRRAILFLIPLAMGLQLLSGCKGCEPPPIPVEPKKPDKAVKQTSPDTEISKTKLDDPKGIEQACATLHDQMKGRVALIKQRQGDTTSKFPPREAVIKTCKELPPAAVRCMITKVARARGMECRALFKSLKPEQLQKVSTWRNFLWTGSLTPPKMPPPKKAPKAMPKK
jgi:hypothetical protein